MHFENDQQQQQHDETPSTPRTSVHTEQQGSRIYREKAIQQSNKVS